MSWLLRSNFKQIHPSTKPIKNLFFVFFTHGNFLSRHQQNKTSKHKTNTKFILKVLLTVALTKIL